MRIALLLLREAVPACAAAQAARVAMCSCCWLPPAAPLGGSLPAWGCAAGMAMPISRRRLQLLLLMVRMVGSGWAPLLPTRHSRCQRSEDADATDEAASDRWSNRWLAIACCWYCRYCCSQPASVAARPGLTASCMTGGLPEIGCCCSCSLSSVWQGPTGVKAGGECPCHVAAAVPLVVCRPGAAGEPTGTPSTTGPRGEGPADTVGDSGYNRGEPPPPLLSEPLLSAAAVLPPSDSASQRRTPAACASWRRSKRKRSARALCLHSGSSHLNQHTAHIVQMQCTLCQWRPFAFYLSSTGSTAIQAHLPATPRLVAQLLSVRQLSVVGVVPPLLLLSLAALAEGESGGVATASAPAGCGCPTLHSCSCCP